MHPLIDDGGVERDRDRELSLSCAFQIARAAILQACFFGGLAAFALDAFNVDLYAERAVVVVATLTIEPRFVHVRMPASRTTLAS
jgi:hypothetical protein